MEKVEIQLVGSDCFEGEKVMFVLNVFSDLVDHDNLRTDGLEVAPWKLEDDPAIGDRDYLGPSLD